VALAVELGEQRVETTPVPAKVGALDLLGER
jgi:hypothetical protein